MLENLGNLHSDCELNFVRLSKLMPEMETGDQVRYLAGNHDESFLEIEVTDTDRYTRFLQLSGRMSDIPWAGEQRMAVRFYADARMAEVISCGTERVRLLRYPYPNDQMYAPDEKNRINSFLGKWLEHFLQYGRPLERVNLDSGKLAGDKWDTDKSGRDKTAPDKLEACGEREQEPHKKAPLFGKRRG